MQKAVIEYVLETCSRISEWHFFELWTGSIMVEKRPVKLEISSSRDSVCSLLWRGNALNDPHLSAATLFSKSRFSSHFGAWYWTDSYTKHVLLNIFRYLLLVLNQKDDVRNLGNILHEMGRRTVLWGLGRNRLTTCLIICDNWGIYVQLTLLETEDSVCFTDLNVCSENEPWLPSFMYFIPIFRQTQQDIFTGNILGPNTRLALQSH